MEGLCRGQYERPAVALLFTRCGVRGCDPRGYEEQARYYRIGSRCGIEAFRRSALVDRRDFAFDALDEAIEVWQFALC